MRLFIYLITADDGFAPNPFYGYCTLATCKPGIRSHAKEGEWVIGLGSPTLSKKAGKDVGIDKIIYTMKIDEVLTWREYSVDPRFKVKIPRYSQDEDNPVEEKGDNVYYCHNGIWYGRPSFHYEKLNLMKRDLDGKNVLISKDFYYFGRSAIKIPDDIFQKLKDVELKASYHP